MPTGKSAELSGKSKYAWLSRMRLAVGVPARSGSVMLLARSRLLHAQKTHHSKGQPYNHKVKTHTRSVVPACQYVNKHMQFYVKSDCDG